MPRHPCSYDGERKREKLASVYVWWYLPEGDRVSYLIRSCAECLIERWKPILQSTNSTLTGTATCVGCGGGLETDDTPVYCKLYLPNQVEREFELDFDAPCAARICADISDFGEKLANRGDKVEGPRNSAPQHDPWAELELA